MQKFDLLFSTRNAENANTLPKTKFGFHSKRGDAKVVMNLEIPAFVCTSLLLRQHSKFSRSAKVLSFVKAGSMLLYNL